MKSLVRFTLGVALTAGATSFVASAQSVISAKSGLIHYAEGRVYLGDKLVESQFGSFPDIKENAQVRTEDGRAEVLLTPGVFLRIGENSAIRMVTNRLIDTRLEFLSGSILVEADELPKDNGVTIVYKDYSIKLQQKGVYRFDSDPAVLRVYDGGVVADLNGKAEEIKQGRLLPLDGDLKTAKFDKDKETDALYRWSRRRSEYLAMANVSAAKSVRDSGSNWQSSSWYFNPYFNMYTFIPGRGAYYNPFGFALWSPFTVYDYLYSPGYYRTGYYGGGNGGRVSRGVSSTSAGAAVAPTRSGLSGTVASSSGSVRSPSTAASNSNGGGVSRSGGMGGGVVGAGGGGGMGRAGGGAGGRGK
jgi:hypothetical protein